MSRLKKKEYELRLKALQVELNQLTRWLRHTERRLVVIFEGRDTAGKGGAINAIASKLNPRQVHVVALAKPSDCEQQQWYFQRYAAHLPAAGQMVLFDRSWYNRAGVERVMGFCTDAQYRSFLKDAPLFEKMLVDDGIMLVKYWLSVDQTLQEERFAERVADPVKRWKLSPIDVEARKKYVEYGRARDAMFRATHKRRAPWTVVDFNDQKAGRLTLIRHLLDQVPDRRVRETPIALPRLKRRPVKERFTGPVKPIPPRF
ncbi:MAG: polyphosphate kinase 2 [Acidobacteriota bacterium]|nr:polyphosphate kinase 2 [Acidobacteriota bacterium]